MIGKNIDMKNILVVDDDKNMRNLLSRILAHERYNTKIAKNGTEALDILNTYEIDIVLLDLVLPDINGMDILKTIKIKYPSIEIVMISGHGTSEKIVNLIKEGAYDFIEKPFDNKTVSSKISKAIKQRKLNLKFKFLDNQ